MSFEVILENETCHSFHDRNDPRTYTGIMPSLCANLSLVSRRDASQYATCVVCHKSIRGHLVVVFLSCHVRRTKSRSEFDSFHSPYREHGFGKIGVELVKDRLPDTGRDTRNPAFSYPGLSGYPFRLNRRLA